MKIEARKIDDAGMAIAGELWAILEENIYTDATPDARRYTRSFYVDDARYELRVTRVGAEATASTLQDGCLWESARLFCDEAELDFSGLTLLAVKIKATENISSRNTQRMNCLVTRKLRSWSPDDGWSDSASETSSIAWAMADCLSSQVYGAKIIDSQIDLQGLYDLHQVWNARGDEFNAIFDRKISLWEALQQIARVGRASIILQGGVTRIIRDTLQTLPTMQFSARNIVKGSFSIAYSLANDDANDGVIITYRDKEIWSDKEIAVNATGGNPTNPAKLTLFGCTNATQARKEALYLARNNVYRRKTIKFETELEGHIPTFGDYVIVSHDMPEWGVSGDIIGWDEDNNHLILSEPIKFADDDSNVIFFRAKNGALYDEFSPVAVANNEFALALSATNITYELNVAGDRLKITYGSDNSSIAYLYFGLQYERTQFIFGKTNNTVQYGIVRSVKPRGKNKVQITVLSENSAVHDD